MDKESHIHSSDLFRDCRYLKLWQARHSLVLDFIEKKNIRSMIDYGCSEGTLIKKIQRGNQIALVRGIDIDFNTLETAISYNQPEGLLNDLAYQRNYDQIVQFYHGSVLQKHQQLKLEGNIDLITFIEVIQHIEQKYIPQINDNIFGFLRPTYVILSTPNCEFNPLFKWQDKQKFRHDDHKFQWNRGQFKKYVDNVSYKYGYQAQITGVGLPLLQQNDKHGYCTQIAIFKRKQQSQSKSVQKSINSYQSIINTNKTSFSGQKVPLKLIKRYVNPGWQSVKSQRIETMLKQIQFKCKSNGQRLDWNDVFKIVQKQKVYQRLVKQDEKYCYEFYLKDFITRKCVQYHIKMRASQDKKGLQYIHDATQNTSCKSLDQEFSSICFDQQEQQISQFYLNNKDRRIFNNQDQGKSQSMEPQKLNKHQQRQFTIYDYDNSNIVAEYRRDRAQKSKKSSSEKELSRKSSSQKKREKNKEQRDISDWGQVQVDYDQILKNKRHTRKYGRRKRHNKTQITNKVQSFQAPLDSKQYQIQSNLSKSCNYRQ